MLEPGNEDDNLGTAALDVTLAPYADLEVTRVQADTLLVDDPAELTVEWLDLNMAGAELGDPPRIQRLTLGMVR